MINNRKPNPPAPPENETMTRGNPMPPENVWLTRTQIIAREKQQRAWDAHIRHLRGESDTPVVGTTSGNLSEEDLNTWSFFAAMRFSVFASIFIAIVAILAKYFTE